MKIKLYPKELLEAAWKQDKKLYAHGDAAAPPKCLRCGSPLAAHLMVNALSRYADVQICEPFGMPPIRPCPLRSGMPSSLDI